jgi:hypothetical protein
MIELGKEERMHLVTWRTSVQIKDYKTWRHQRMRKNLSKIIILQLSRLENRIVTQLQILGICCLNMKKRKH